MILYFLGSLEGYKANFRQFGVLMRSNCVSPMEMKFSLARGGLCSCDLVLVLVTSRRGDQGGVLVVREVWLNSRIGIFLMEQV